MIKTYLALFGAICILLIGNSPSVISPFIVGSFEDYFNLSKQSVGNLMSLELGLMAISSIFFSTFKINYKLSHLIILGVSIVLIAYLLTSFAINTTQLALIRAFSGIGCGLLIAKGHALIASNNNPEKSYAFFSMSSTIVGAIIIYVSGSILNNFGYQSFFISLFVFYLLLIPLILFIKEKPVNEVIKPGSEDLNLKTVSLLIIGILSFELASGGMWAFDERLGVEFIGISISSVALVLSISTLTGLLAPPIVLYIGNRYGRSLPIYIGVTSILMCFIWILKYPSYFSFFAGNIIWYFFFTMTVIYVLAASAIISPTGRLASWLNAAILIGMSVAPSLFGYILDRGTFIDLLPLLFAFILITLICITFIRKTLDQTE